MRAKFSLLTVAAMPIIPIALACGGDDGGGKISVKPDAAKQVDAAPIVCTAGSSYAAPGSAAQAAGSDGMMGSDYQVFWFARMDSTSKPDFLQVSLRDGGGVFAGGITPKNNVTIPDVDIDGACGVCPIMFTDLHQVGSSVMETDYYLPTAGTISLTSVSGTFEGTITGLMLEHFVISGNELVQANDGCMVSIPTVTMTATIKPQMTTPATGKPGPTGPHTFLGNRTY